MTCKAAMSEALRSSPDTSTRSRPFSPLPRCHLILMKIQNGRTLPILSFSAFHQVTFTSHPSCMIFDFRKVDGIRGLTFLET